MMEDETCYGPARATRSRAQIDRPYEVPPVKRRRGKKPNGESETDTQPTSEADETNSNLSIFQPELEINENSVAEVINLNLHLNPNEEEYERDEGDQTIRNIEQSLADEMREQLGDNADPADLEHLGLPLTPSRMHPRVSPTVATQTARKSQQQVSPEENDQNMVTVLKQPAKRNTPPSPQNQTQNPEQQDQNLREMFAHYLPNTMMEQRRNVIDAHARAMTECVPREAPLLINLEEENEEEEEPLARRTRQKNVERQKPVCPPPINRTQKTQVRPIMRNTHETIAQRYQPELFGRNDWVRQKVFSALHTLRIPEPGYDQESKEEFVRKVIDIRG